MTAARADAEAFSSRTMVALIAVGVFALAAALTLIAYAPELRRSAGSGENALSRSAVGFGGAVTLLKARGVRVVVRGEARGIRTGVAVFTPTLATDGDDLAEPWTHPALIVLPKWRTAPHRKHAGWVQNEGLAAPGDVAQVLEKLAGGTRISRRDGSGVVELSTRPAVMRGRLLPGQEGREPDRPVFPAGLRLRSGPIASLQTVEGTHWTPVLVDARGQAVLAKHHRQNTWLLADPDLLNTQGLADPATARAGMAILDGLRGPGAPVVFDLTLHGVGDSRSLLRLALGPPFLGAVLCLVFAGILMGLHAGVRFGPTRRQERALALGKTALADNTAALIRLTGREHRMAAGYAALIRAAAARAVGAPRDLSPEQLDALLDRLGRRRGASDDYSTLAQQAAAVSGRDELLRLARTLHRWKQEITGGHR